MQTSLDAAQTLIRGAVRHRAGGELRIVANAFHLILRFWMRLLASAPKSSRKPGALKGLSYRDDPSGEEIVGLISAAPSGCMCRMATPGVLINLRRAHFAAINLSHAINYLTNS